MKEVGEKISDRVKLKKIIDSAISAEKVSDMFLTLCYLVLTVTHLCLIYSFSLKQKILKIRQHRF